MDRNVHEAYLQAGRAKRYIQSTHVPKLRESKGIRRELKIDGSQVQGYLKVAVSLEHLDGIAFQLQATRDLGLFGHDEYPWSVSLADLDVICDTCEGPEVLVHYGISRHSLMSRPTRFIGDELGLFAYYLDTRFVTQRLPERLDLCQFVGFSERFDELMEYRRGDKPEKPDIRLRVPGWISELLSELRNRAGDPAAQRIALKILSLDPEILEALGEQIPLGRAAPREGTGIRRFELPGCDPVVLALFGDERDTSEWSKALGARLALLKYRVKAERALGFGILRWDRRPVSTALWLEYPWERDDFMEEQLRNDVPMVVHNRRLPGRNEKCLCGSGKKFKHCCLERVRRG